MSLSEALQTLYRIDDLTGGRRYLGFVGCNGTMGGILKQSGGIHINLHSLRCGLASQLRLNLRCEFYRDSQRPSPLLP